MSKVSHMTMERLRQLSQLEGALKSRKESTIELKVNGGEIRMEVKLPACHKRDNAYMVFQEDGTITDSTISKSAMSRHIKGAIEYQEQMKPTGT